MNYKINYKLKGGSSRNANIIWNNKNHIVLNNKIANQLTQHIGITYEYYKCNKSLDPFECTKLDDDDEHKVDFWAHDDNIDLSWLNNGMNGMTNCGNTCYFNSYMQCILFTYPLIYHIQLIIKSNIDSNNIFEELVQKKFKDNKLIEMEPIIQNFIDKKAAFTIGKQQDSHEFFKNFMDYLDINLIINNQTLLDKYFDNTKYYPSNFIFYDPRKRKGDYKNMSLIKYYFEFFMTTKKNLSLIVPDSRPHNLTTYTTDPFQDIQLNINGTNLDECFDEYFKEEKLKDEQRRNLDPDYPDYEFDTNTIKFVTLPKILCISLKRFRTEIVGKKMVEKKIDTQVDMPYVITKNMLSKFMWINKYGNMNPIYDYDLYAFSYHDGSSSSSGHYVSYINKPTFEDDKYNIFHPRWYIANDGSFNGVDKSVIDYSKNKGYIYFYKARDSDQDFPHHIGNKDITFKYN